MREVKFRAWDKATCSMLSENDASGAKFWKLYLNGGVEIHSVWATSDVELMQFIGLKDKNDVEIYEDDIVKFDKDSDVYTKAGELHQVRFSAGYGARWEGVPLKYLYDKNYGDWCGGGEMRQFWGFETVVVGNIYENPELLNVPTHS